MSNIPDFNDTELWIVRAAMTECYGKTVELQLADSELRLELDSFALPRCPTDFNHYTGPRECLTRP